MFATQSPFPQYFDIDGEPLDAGRLYFGVAGQNPETTPISVYWDAAGTQPAAQPIRTLNGYAVRNGTPAQIYAGSDYSLSVRNKRGLLVVYAPSALAFSNVLSLSVDLASTTDAAKGPALVGLNPTLAYPQGTIGNRLRERVSVTDYPWLAVPGEADSTAKIQAAIDWAFSVGGREVYVPGFFNTSATILHKDNVTLVGPGSLSAGLICSNTGVAVITHTSQDTTTAGARAGFSQSIFGLTLQHNGLAAPFSNFPNAHGISVPFTSAANFISVRGGRYDDVLIVNACDGFHIGGELFEYNIGSIRTNYCYRAWSKTGIGSCTTLSIDSLRMFSCFHGIRANNTIYSTIGWYADHCGLNANSISFGPATEMPILCDLDASPGVSMPYIGAEVSPAVMFRLTGFSQVNVLSSSFSLDPANYWAQSGVRITNIAAASQAFLASMVNSTLNWSSFNVTMLTGSGFPTAATTASNLFVFGAADTSVVSLKSHLINVDSYYWGVNAQFAQNPTTGQLYSPNFDIAAGESSFAFHRTFGKVQLVSPRDAMYAEGTWVPIDSSGAGLVFTGVTGTFTRIGRVVFLNGTLTYPATANASVAAIGGLPFSAKAGNPLHSVTVGYSGAGTPAARGVIAAGAASISLYNAANVAVTNASLTTSLLSFSATYFVD